MSALLLKELCRKHGFSDASFYTWHAKFSGMEGTGGPVAEGPGGREWQAEEATGRGNARHGSIEGHREEKALSPQAKRETVTAHLVELAHEQHRFGYRRLHV